MFIESWYEISTEKVFIKWWYIPWNIWWITYSINKWFDDPVWNILKENLPVFIKWLLRTWMWFWTRLGLWQCEWIVYK
jgi:hypothetical protein